MANSYKLSQEQIDHFMRFGYVRVPDCFSKAKANEWAGDVWSRLGYSPTDKSTWANEMTWMGDTKEEAVKTFAPKAWAAICELLGGEDRVASESATWNDALIVNLGSPESEGKWPNPADLPEWHVDGDFFTHFLDSPEQAFWSYPCSPISRIVQVALWSVRMRSSSLPSTWYVVEPPSPTWRRF